MIPATTVLEFIEHHETCSMVNYVVTCGPFSSFRRAVRLMVLCLRDVDTAESTELARRLRAVLSKWLTTPAPFSSDMAEQLRALGAPSRVEHRWGSAIRAGYEQALAAAERLAGIENPLRVILRDLIRINRRQQKMVRVYSSRAAFPDFLSLLPSHDPCAIRQEDLMSSVSTYRDSMPFDVLIKVGPLRARGWGAAPDALLTAPRFCSLVKIVWAGCEDEVGFGYDPVEVTTSVDGTGRAPNVAHPTALSRVSWEERTILTEGSDSDELPPASDADDLAILSAEYVRDKTRHAVLIQIDGRHGYFYPRLASVLSFNPLARNGLPVDVRTPSESLSAGMFLALPQVGSVDLGETDVHEGAFSREWKARLHAELASDPRGLAVRLRKAGVDLRGIAQAAERWTMPARSVIPAPKTYEHFRMLMQVLRMGSTLQQPDGDPSWWRRAWDEVAESRGQAIQSGLVEHQLIDEELVRVLNDQCLEAIESAAQTQDSFLLALPSACALPGFVRFDRIAFLEEGYIVPDDELRVLVDIDAIDQWRA